MSNRQQATDEPDNPRQAALPGEIAKIQNDVECPADYEHDCQCIDQPALGLGDMGYHDARKEDREHLKTVLMGRQRSGTATAQAPLLPTRIMIVVATAFCTHRLGDWELAGVDQQHTYKKAPERNRHASAPDEVITRQVARSYRLCRLPEQPPSTSTHREGDPILPSSFRFWLADVPQ